MAFFVWKFDEVIEFLNLCPSILRSFFAIVLSDIFFCFNLSLSFWDSNYVRIFEIVPQISEALLIFC